METLQLHRAVERAERMLRRSQRPDGSWDAAGHLGSWVTAQVVVVLAHLGRLSPEDGSEAGRWLRGQQLPDGAFLLYPSAAEGHLDATACAWAALHAIGGSANAEAEKKAREWVQRAGGVPAVLEGMALGNLGAVYLVLAGLLDAAAVPVPATAPLLVPPLLRFLQTRFHSGVFQAAFELSVLLRRLRGDWGPDGQRKGVMGALTCRRLVELLEPFQNPDGSWNDSCVLTVLALPALAAAGEGPATPLLSRGVAWLESQKVQDASGVRFDGFGTEVWSTAFDVRALLVCGLPPESPVLTRALTWLMDAQLHTPMPRVDDRQAGAPLTGGWAFQRSNPRMPDCDDTGVVLSALGAALGKLRASGGPPPLVERLQTCVEAGAAWLTGMQNPDGGWSAFVWGLPGKAPGPMMETTPRVDLRHPLAVAALVLRPPPSLGDPSTEDVTARVLHGLGQLGRTAHHPEVAHAVEFLRRQQCPSGAWWGRWVVNYLSCTAFVLMGLEAVGVDMAQAWIRRAVEWMRAHQNADGGWGEGPESYRNEALAGRGPSMAPLTGLVLQGLMAAGDGPGPSVERGVAFLLRAQRPDGSWPNDDYLHTNIPPDTFYVYPEAARFYPTEALARFRQARTRVGDPEQLAPARWTDAQMDRLRQSGDPLADGVIAEIRAEGSTPAVNALLAGIFRSDAPLPEGLPPRARRYFEETAALPAWSDPSKIALAQDLFRRTGGFVAAGLFCSSLPQAYAAAKGAQVLTQTLGMTRHVRQRVYETAQFLFDVLDENGLAPSGRGVRAAQKVRLMHAAIRSLLLQRPEPAWDVAAQGIPINQEDLAGTLMTFSAVTLEALERFDLPVTPEEAEAWIHTWAVVGHLMGIDPSVLPPDRASAAELMDLIRQRQWGVSESGARLMQPLLEMMQGFLPGPELHALPVVLVRHLAGDHCADLLGLPPASWSHVLSLASEALAVVEGSEGQGPMERLLAHGTQALIQGIVLVEREGKQAKFRIPTSLRKTVDERA